MIEKGIRGEISMISNSHGKANNPYMGKKYNDKEATKYITYLDANNLYGWAMSKPLTTDEFKWMSEREVFLEVFQCRVEQEYRHAVVQLII